MVQFNLLRKGRRNRKNGTASPRNAVSTPSSNRDESSSSFYSSEDESSLSSQSFYSSSDSEEYSWDDESYESGLSTSTASNATTAPCSVPNMFVRAIAQYASLDICRTKDEATPQPDSNVDTKSPKSPKQGENEKRSRGLKAFQDKVGGKFETMMKKNNLDGKKKTSIESSSTIQEDDEKKLKPNDKDSVSFTETIQKQLQEWTDRAKKFEGTILLNAYQSKKEEEDDKGVSVTTLVQEEAIESRNANNEGTRGETEIRDPPLLSSPRKTILSPRKTVLSPRRALLSPRKTTIMSPTKTVLSPTKTILSPRQTRHDRLLNRKSSIFKSRERTKSDGHRDSFKTTTIISPRLTTNVHVPAEPSPEQSKKCLCSPMNKLSVAKKRPEKISQPQDDIDIDELVAHVLWRGSSEASFEQNENKMLQQRPTSDRDTFGGASKDISTSFERRQSDHEAEATANKLELAQKEIDYLKRLLQEKERVAGINLQKTEEQSCMSSTHRSNTQENDTDAMQVMTHDSETNLSAKLAAPDSFDEKYSQEGSFPSIPIDFEPFHVEETSWQHHSNESDLFWDNLFGKSESQEDDNTDEMSLLSKPFSPRRYGKLKRISKRKVLK